MMNVSFKYVGVSLESLIVVDRFKFGDGCVIENDWLLL